jgi:deazaflavin-dependent oxidoreductase (nitroreductase family)
VTAKIKDIEMSNKPARNHDFGERLSRSREITITVTGRKSGGAISVPVWFVSDDNKLYLLPARGSDTEWYKNVLKNPSMRIDAGGVKAEFKVAPLTDTKQVASVIDMFHAKYGDSGIKLYKKLDVAVIAPMQPTSA